MTFDQKNTVREGYDKLSHAYRADETPDSYGDYAGWVDELARRLPAGAPVLDIGCGCGLPATKLLARRFDVTGIDLSPVQIERARKFVPSARFICSDAAAARFADESFAAVVSFYAIIHIPLDEHRELFARIARWLRPGGRLLAIVGHDAWTGTDESYLGVAGVRMAWSHADEATNLRWISEAGLSIEWKRFIPEGAAGHTLVLAEKPPVTK